MITFYTVLSVDSEVKTVMKGIKHGACDYLVKPVRIEELKLIWKHVIKKSVHDAKSTKDTKSKFDTLSKSEEDSSTKLIRKCKGKKRDKDGDDNDSSDGDFSTQKKPRITWTSELHSKFIDAVNKLGLDSKYG